MTEVNIFQMIDIRGGVVEIKVQTSDGKARVIHVNVDGICRLRIQEPEFCSYSRNSRSTKGESSGLRSE